MQKMTPSDGQSMNVVDENIAVLKKAFPEAFTEDGIDFEVLRQLLGDNVAEGEEKYGLNWFGKKKARQIALIPSMGTLRPCPEESVDWGATQNLFIEGDNLEVLKLLQRGYAGKVKMIYIDPPYNTGKEFIYPDKYQDTLDTYLRYTGQKDREGFKIRSNTESSGRYHTNWLNMMYPRLKLARVLLSELGSIFITIDETELSNVISIMNDIFGEENFVSTISWHKRVSPANDAKFFSTDCDTIVVYAKNKEIWRPNKLQRTGAQLEYYKNPDDDERGRWNSATYTCNRSKEERPNLYYPIVNPNTGEEVWPKETAVWRYGPEVTQELLDDDRLYWGADGNAKFPRVKLFLSEMKGVVPRSLWSGGETGNTQVAATEIAKLFDGKRVFDTPKPTSLLSRILEIGISNPNEIVLDFFAGSASMAHAAIARSVETGSAIRFVMVQLPELINEKHDAAKLGFKHIADVGMERIRRAAGEIKKNNPLYQGDLGFKVFKLDSSNIVAWNPDKTDLEQTLLGHTEHLVPGRSEQDVLYELLLKRGVELTAPIEEKEIAGKKVYSIGFGVLFACLDKKIQRDQIEELAHGIIDWHKELDPISDTQVVFRDSAFENDVTKANMTAILEQNGVKHVRSL
jgi:adenine-specific DNA-methyltransferase